MTDRTSFLARIERHLSEVEPPPLPTELPQTPASGDGRPLTFRFAEELATIGGEAATVARGELVEAVAGVATGIGASSAVLGPDLGSYREDVVRGLRGAGAEVAEPDDREEWRAAAAKADLGVTGAVVGVASAGSVLITAGPSSSRLCSLLPAAHLAILSANRLVAGFEELFSLMPEALRAASSAVLVTGPSRTADIEMAIVRGVHGPRSLHVLLMERER